MESLINRRRRQVLIHSAIYYRWNKSIIDDHTFDKWAKELADLQTAYPEIASKCVYAKEFEDFDGSSGFDLPHHYPEVQSTALKLLRYHKERLK
jgi:NAD-dependent DNA ligase